MAVYGLMGSFGHAENGMTLSDMHATVRVANDLDEVIIFRSTGPWSQRWIERGYPTKNFHVKGKSSDWGPQAGFVPYEGIYSKVGADPQKAADGKTANQDGIDHGYAAKVQLMLSREEINLQLNKPEENPPRHALVRMAQVPDSKDLFLVGRRSGDNKEFVFRAVVAGSTTFTIWVYPEKLGTNLTRLMFERPTPLEVMTSSEVGADNKPMTGDYDLMSVCPTWDSYGGTSNAVISKPGIRFSGKKGLQLGQQFDVGARMDKVLDMRSNTGARPKLGNTKVTFQGMTKRDGGKLAEHGDMGNITPRILRCINMLNAAMGATGGKSAGRRVHHNAESHRNHIFGALVEADMKKGDGFPMTVFQPARLQGYQSPTAKYRDVATLDTMGEFRAYALLLNEAGYYVPRNWTWGMSVRDNAADMQRYF
ncbi:anthrax toxin-like adenylyl cyclase domain-containing protein [Rhodoferax saidenbachensis]|uniref:Anthrax toxin edema factor central domain-containing protein n=1 Tax=Rhodoferax saidenbachensis TaxID=1484693 RepID=A0A1P8KER4_9BURK|nr:anthrax toxin-like adenylyl cyclase domain-containing protein [Rhodoferax saidenbachensis]APW44509.1 hypothetical protein RS694_19625 [Rhodoferax saidenbachensis]